MNHHFINLKFTCAAGGSVEMRFPQAHTKRNIRRWKIVGWITPLKVEWKE